MLKPHLLIIFECVFSVMFKQTALHFDSLSSVLARDVLQSGAAVAMLVDPV